MKPNDNVKINMSYTICSKLNETRSKLTLTELIPKMTVTTNFTNIGARMIHTANVLTCNNELHLT